MHSEDFNKADRFLHPGKILDGIINRDIEFQWMNQGAVLWYKLQAAHSRQYLKVDADTGEAAPLFDHILMGKTLAAALGKEVDPNNLPILKLQVLSNTQFVVTICQSEQSTGNSVPENEWLCDLTETSCEPYPKIELHTSAVTSPCGRYRVFTNDHNLWLVDTADNNQRPLTTDGIASFGYGETPESDVHSNMLQREKEGPGPAHVLWATSGEKFVSFRADERHVKSLSLLQAVPDDGSFRPQEIHFHHNLAGEDGYRAYLTIFDINNQQSIEVNYRPLTGSTGYRGPIEANNLWWNNDASKLYLLDVDSSCRKLTLVEVEAASGNSKILLEENDDRQLLPAPPMTAPLVRVLSNGDIIWFSERSGWGHLYLYDGSTLSLKQSITQGNWLVRDILHINEENNWIYFTASGVQAEVDIYFTSLYRVKLDGTEMQMLTPERANHELSIPTERERQTKKSPATISFSPSGQYFVDRYSTPENPGAWVLRSIDGSLIRKLADVSTEIPEDFPQIETFKLKSADGKYDLYGTLIKPSDFDPKKLYPIVDGIYPGPQNIVSSKTFEGTLSNVFHPMGLVDLGFVIISIDGRGTPTRSKAFRDISYGNAEQAGSLEDHISAIQQLAVSRPYIDVERVGIYGVSGGGFAAAHAMFDYPDFFKVGVAASGNHEWRTYSSAWGERWHGPLQEQDYDKVFSAAKVHNLQGKLLLMHGELDDNVHPANTLRVVDELIKAKKRFDMLIIPNGDHGAAASSYFQRITQYYFLEHLAGVDVPKSADLP